jgi:hypothetical protein
MNIFPRWKSVLTNEIFNEYSRVWEIVLGGSIGGGKTVMGNLCQVFNILRVCSLRQPQLTLGVMPSTSLFVQLISITLDKAGLALIKPLMDLIKEISFFEQVKHEDNFNDFINSPKIPFIDRIDKGMILFPNNITIMTGSRISHTLSFSLIGASLDEAEFRISGTNDAIEVYTNLKERIRSRFLDSYRYTFLSLISSARYTTGVIADYVKALKPDDPGTKYYHFPIWEIRSFDSYKNGSFYAMRGTRAHPSKVLNELEENDYKEDKFVVPSNCEVIKVPLSYRADFDRRIEEALRNLAGVQTLGSEFLFDDLTNIEYKDLPGEITIEINLGNKDEIINLLPKNFLKLYNNSLRLSRYPNAVRYAHIDLAATSEAGIGIVHKELLEPENVIYVPDMMLRIVTKTRIELEVILKFFIYLVQEAGVRFHKVSSDTFQSEYILQKLKTENVATEVGVVSMDRTNVPYRIFSEVVSSNSFNCGECPILKNQLNKIFEDEGKITTTDRKDLADGVGGAVYNAVMNTREFPIHPRKVITNISKNLGIDQKALLEI